MHSFKRFILLSSALTVLLAACGNTGNNDFTTTEVPTEARVTVVEFSDFNCPGCRASYPITREVRKMDGVHFEYRNFPLDIVGHETSFAAANAFECGAVQGKADEMESALFDNQGKFTDELLRTLPEKYAIDLDLTSYQSCVDNGEQNSKVLDDARTATRAGLNSTPSFIVDGEIVRGAGQLIDIVEAKLAE